MTHFCQKWTGTKAVKRAKALIMAGQVYVKPKCDKAGQMVDEDTTVAEIRGETLKICKPWRIKT